MTPLERAARALCAGKGIDPDHIGTGMCGDAAWMFEVDKAATVLQAIRDPSDAMIQASADEGECHGTHISVYRAMIDAALEEG